MGEILFRGKRIDNGGWVYGCLIYNLDPSNPEDVIREAWIREPLGNIAAAFAVIPESVGQYTGIKDESGVKVFVGDIIEHCPEYMDGHIGYDEAEIDIVEFDDCGFIPMAGEMWSGENMRVIGNIHDNPELMPHGITEEAV